MEHRVTQQGDTVTDCNPSQEDWTQGAASGQNTTANRLMNVVREAPALSNGTTD